MSEHSNDREKYSPRDHYGQWVMREIRDDVLRRLAHSLCKRPRLADERVGKSEASSARARLIVHIVDSVLEVAMLQFDRLTSDEMRIEVRDPTITDGTRDWISADFLTLYQCYSEWIERWAEIDATEFERMIRECDVRWPVTGAVPTDTPGMHIPLGDNIVR